MSYLFAYLTIFSKKWTFSILYCSIYNFCLDFFCRGCLPCSVWMLMYAHFFILIFIFKPGCLEVTQVSVYLSGQPWLGRFCAETPLVSWCCHKKIPSIRWLNSHHSGILIQIFSIWNAVSQATVLILPQIKLHSQLSRCALFKVNTT